MKELTPQQKAALQLWNRIAKAFETHLAFTTETFVNSTAASSMQHLKTECDEVIEELNSVKVEDYPEAIIKLANEYADCALVLMDSINRSGVGAMQIIEAIERKIVINKSRKWKLNENGSYSHIKE